MKKFLSPAGKLADYLTTAALVLVPFYAFLTVWGSTLVGHYTALRLWDDVLLLALFLVACYRLARDRELLGWFTHSLLARLIFAYCVLTLLLGVIALAKGEVTGKALAYGIRINLRFPVWFLSVLVTTRRSSLQRSAWAWLLMVPAGLVVAFAVLQYTVLPYTFLSHFGYNAATTITPIETINHNAHYIRAQSTLRGANPLGAYLVIILSALGVLLLRSQRKLLWAGFGIVALAALYASGSRSAWIGTLLALGVIAWLRLKTGRGRQLFGSIGVAIVVAALGGYLLLRGNTALQNEVLHTQDNSAVSTNSNSAHAAATENGLRDVLRQPLGDGPGTAGPASVYNGSHPPRIAEDYYVQIAQETGWIGLALFLSILILVALELYERATEASPVSLALFASFVGLAFVNLVSHAWADDTLAYVWWGLAGIALVRPLGPKDSA